MHADSAAAAVLAGGRSSSAASVLLGAGANAGECLLRPRVVARRALSFISRILTGTQCVNNIKGCVGKSGCVGGLFFVPRTRRLPQGRGSRDLESTLSRSFFRYVQWPRSVSRARKRRGVERTLKK